MIPEEADGVFCKNRNNCEKCNVDNHLYCDVCNDGFELQKLEDFEYGYCLPENMDIQDLDDINNLIDLMEGQD